MTRDEAIAIIRKEYLCVDRDCGIEKNCGKCDLVMPSKEPILEAFKMAIKALEQEPVLGKIRAEIEQEYSRLRATRADETLELGECLGLKMSLKIIDMYKAEKEEHHGSD